MTAVIRSLADSLRRFGDDRLEALLVARPDLASPPPRGVGPLAARAAGPTSARRALDALTLPELHLIEALAVIPDGSSPAQLAAAVGAGPEEITGALERVITLALVWGEDELHLIRPLREGLRTPAGLAAPDPADPAPEEAAQIIERSREDLSSVLETLAWGPSAVAGSGKLATQLIARGIVVAGDDGQLRIPRPVQLALRGGRVHAAHHARRPLPEGEALIETVPGSRTAQAVELAFEALRLAATVRSFDDDPPGVLRRGGLPQRDLRRLAERAGTPVSTLATILQAAWQAGLIGHDGQEWHPTRDWDEHALLPAEQRWAELVLAWARGHHVASLAGTADPTGAPRPLLSDQTRREGVRTRRGALLRALQTTPSLSATEESLARSLAWAFPRVPAEVIREETAALLTEGRVLGVIEDGALTALGQELVAVLEEPAPTAHERLAACLLQLAPPPVTEVLLDADLTAVVPGRPAPELLVLLDWTEVISRGGALTLRFTPAAVRRAIGEGRDADALLALLEKASRSPIPQALTYLLRDEQRRHGRIRVGRASTVLTAEAEVLDLLQASPEATALQLRRLTPTVAVTLTDPGFALQVAREAGLAPQAVGPDGAPAPEDLTHSLRGGPVEPDLVTVEGPELRIPAAEAVARIRAADAGEQAKSLTDRLLEAIAEGRELRLGVVDGRGGIETHQVVPLSLEGGRLRARQADGTELSVLVHRVTLG